MQNNIGAKRLERFPEYPYVALSQMKKEVEKTDNCVVLDLSIGSPTFPPYKGYMDKLSEFILNDKSHLYPAAGAIPELKSALQNWYKKRFNVTLLDNELYPLIGAKDGVSHIPLAILNEGDEILIPNPGYPGFTGPALMVGAVPTYYQLPNEGVSLLSMIEEKASSKTKAIWVNSPGNPTGYTFTRSDLEQIVEFAKNKNIIIIFDNAYSEITFGSYKAPSILEIKGAHDVAVEIGSFSKTFSFAGFRMAWIVGNSDVIAAVAKVKSQMDSGFMHPLQLLGAYVLNNFNTEWHEGMIEFYKKNRDALADAFQHSGHTVTVPNGALYLWIKIPVGFKNGLEYTQFLLTKHHILVTPGSVFGSSGEKYIRVSYSSDISSLANYFPFK
jgi:LL-diaminopimelate aminotransferase